MTHQFAKVLNTSSKNKTIFRIPSIVHKVLKDEQYTP